MFSTKGKKKRIRTKRQPKTLKDILNDAFKRQLVKNPDLATKIAFKEAGHLDMLPDAEDPLEVKKKEIKGKLMDRSLQRFEKDPTFLDAHAESLLGEVIGEASGQYGRYDEEPGYDDIDTLIDRIDKVKELSEKLEGGRKSNGFASLFKDPEVVGALSQVFAMLLSGGKKPSGVQAQRIYVVDDGKGNFLELDAAGLKHFYEGRRQLVPPQQLPTNEFVPVSLGGQEANPPEIKTLSITDWIPYLTEEPEIFIANLQEQALDDQSAQFALTLLKAKTSDEILALLQPFKASDDAREAIEALEQNKEWLDRVIELLREEVTDE